MGVMRLRSASRPDTPSPDVLRSPKLTHLSRRLTGVWFLLRRGQFHQGREAPASAPLSTGVFSVRGTPGHLDAKASGWLGRLGWLGWLGWRWHRTGRGFRPARMPQDATGCHRMPQDATTETSSARLFSPVKAEKTPQKGGKDHEISNQLSPFAGGAAGELLINRDKHHL